MYRPLLSKMITYLLSVGQQACSCAHHMCYLFEKRTEQKGIADVSFPNRVEDSISSIYTWAVYTIIKIESLIIQPLCLLEFSRWTCQNEHSRGLIRIRQYIFRGTVLNSILLFDFLNDIGLSEVHLCIKATVKLSSLLSSVQKYCHWSRESSVESMRWGSNSVTRRDKTKETWGGDWF